MILYVSCVTIPGSMLYIDEAESESIEGVRLEGRNEAKDRWKKRKDKDRV